MFTKQKNGTVVILLCTLFTDSFYYNAKSLRFEADHCIWAYRISKCAC